MTYLEHEAYSEHCQTSIMERFAKVATWRALKKVLSYISGNGNPEKNSLYFRKRNILIFHERYIQNPDITELYYIFGNGAF